MLGQHRGVHSSRPTQHPRAVAAPPASPGGPGHVGGPGTAAAGGGCSRITRARRRQQPQHAQHTRRGARTPGPTPLRQPGRRFVAWPEEVIIRASAPPHQYHRASVRVHCEMACENRFDVMALSYMYVLTAARGRMCVPKLAILCTQADSHVVCMYLQRRGAAYVSQN